MKVKIIFSVLLVIILLDCTVSTAASLNASNNGSSNTSTKNSYISIKTPYAIYDPDGWSSASNPVKGLLKFYDGEINDPEYLATHIIWANNTSDVNWTSRIYWENQTVFVPHEKGWKFTGVFRIYYYTGSYNLSDKITYYEDDGSYDYIELSGGPFSFSNSTVYSLNETKYISGINVTTFQNSVFYDLGSLIMAYTPSKFHVYNITCIGSDIISTYSTNILTNSSFHDIRFENARGFMEIANATNTTLYNISAEGTIPLNEVTGIVFTGGGSSSTYSTVTGGHHNEAWNVSLNGTSRSGFDLTNFEHDFYGHEIEVNTSGHNGFDLHGQWNVTLRNVSVRDCLMENFMITTGNFGPDASAQLSDLYIHNKSGAINVRGITTVSHNISIYNLYAENATGSDLSWNRFVDIYLENATSYNSPQFANINYGENVTIVNATCTNLTSNVAMTLGTEVGTYGAFGYLNDSKFVDCSFTGDGTTSPYIWIVNSRNTSLINVYAPGSEYGISCWSGRQNDYMRYYYPNLRVVNSMNLPVEGAVVTINTTTRNGYGEVQTEYRTDESGRLYDNGNRTNWLAVPEIFHNDSTDIYYTPQITVSKFDRKNSTVVIPSNAWYSPNPASLQGHDIILTLDVPVQTKPVSNFDSNVTFGEAPLAVQFTDTSTGIPTSWGWDFENDGVIDSTAQNPVYIYSTKGNYTVILTVSNEAGSNTVTKSNYISVGADITVQKPVANFSSSVTSGNAPLNVLFTDTSTGVPAKWNWNFGDGTVNSTIQNPTHTYEAAGIYTVTLTVTDPTGNTDSDTCTVTVLEKSEATKVHIISPNATLPGKTFTVDLLVEPGTPISGTQLDFVFNSSKTSVNNVTEGNLFKQSGASAIFSSGSINNTAGTVKNIYGFILGTSNVSSPGTMATVNLTAGSKTGIAEFSLSNVLISDADSKSVPYTVTNATVLIDTAPVMSTICCPKSVDEKSTLTFKVSAKDADCDRLTLSASGLPEGASFNRTSGNFTWTPAVGQAGVYTLTFEVSDGYLTDSENVTVTVNKLNNSPVVNSFQPLNGSSFSEGERIGISVNASDAEGQALNYSIRIDGVVYSTGTEYVWETDYSSSGNHTIEVVVSDGNDEVKEQHKIYISECRPRWDVDENGIVNILDVTSVSQKCGTTVSKPYPRYDVNQDGAVNILDLTLVGNHFGELVK